MTTTKTIAYNWLSTRNRARAAIHISAKRTGSRPGHAIPTRRKERAHDRATLRTLPTLGLRLLPNAGLTLMPNQIVLAILEHVTYTRRQKAPGQPTSA